MIDALTIQLEPDLAARLNNRARRHGISIEQEAHDVLAHGLRDDWESFWQKTEQIQRALSGRQWSDSAELIREDRER